MSLFRDPLRPAPLASDEAIRRYLAAIRADLEPDPLFRRRLRGTVVNRFVAAREGLEDSVRRPSRMGRLGRACLYASFVLITSVSGVMGASRGALPGDLLYPVKLEIEAIRMRALPERFQDDLAAYALAERVNELGRLVEAGELDRAAGLAAAIGDRYAQLVVLGIDDLPQDALLEDRLEVVGVFLDRLPPAARAAVEDAMEHAPGLNGSSPGRNTRSGKAADHASNGNAGSRSVLTTDADPARADAGKRTRPTPRSSHGSSTPATIDAEPTPAD